VKRKKIGSICVWQENGEITDTGLECGKEKVGLGWGEFDT